MSRWAWIAGALALVVVGAAAWWVRRGINELTDAARVGQEMRDDPYVMLEIAAFDARTNAPVGGFRVRVLENGGVADGRLRGATLRARQFAQVHVHEGAVTFILEPTATNRLYMASAPHRVQASKRRTPPQIVRVPEHAMRMVHVTTREGAPVAGTRVQVLVPLENRPITLATFAVAPAALEVLPPGVEALVSYEGATDSNGYNMLEAPADTPVTLRVLGPGNVAKVVTDVVLSPFGARTKSGPITVTVDRGGAISGRLEPTELRASYAPPEKFRAELRSFGRLPPDWMTRFLPGIAVTDLRDATRRWPADANERYPLAADGTFRTPNIEAGSWQIWFCYTSFSDAGSVGQIVEPLDLVTDLKDGETREITIEAPELVPGELRARVFVDGRPFVDSWLRLVRELEDGETVAGPPVLTDADGAFTVSLRAGEWLLSTDLEENDQAEPRWLHFNESAFVTSRTVSHLTLTADRRVVRARVLDASGKPVADRAIEVWTRPFVTHARTDADGRFTLDPAPAARLEIEIEPGIPLGTHELAAGKREVEIELRLPK